MSELNKSVKQKKLNIIVICAVALLALSLCSITSSIIKSNVANADPTIADLQSTLDETSRDYYDALAAQNEAQRKVDEAEVNIAKYSNDIEDSRHKLRERAKSMYINGSNSIIDLLLGATSINELVNVIEVLTIMSNNDNALISECRMLKQQIEDEKDTLDSNLEEANMQASNAADAYNSAQDALAAAQAAAEAAKEREEEDPTPGGGGGGGYLPPETGNAIADRALGEQGKPYVWGGVGPGGYDCSGLVSYAVSGAHTRIGTTSTFMGWPRLSSPQVGCICTSSYHCGIYVGGGMCHAPTFGQTVCVSGVQGDMIFVTP